MWYIFILLGICLCRDTGRNDQAEVSTSTRDMYGKSQRERMDNLDQANQELERLRKQVDKLQAELQGTFDHSWNFCKFYLTHIMIFP